MYSSRLIKILLVALSIFMATRASWVHQDIHARQDLSVGGDDTTSAVDEPTPSPTPSGDTSPTSSPSDEASQTPDEPPSSTDEPPTTTTPIVTPTESNAPPSSPPTTPAGPITTPPNSSPTSTPAPSPSESDSNSDPEDSSTTSQTPNKPITFTSTTTITFTDKDGKEQTSTSAAVVVSTPGFSGPPSKNNDSGITSQTRSIIIGVTVGVGGAIIIAACAFIFWRMRNKRRTQDESEELISYGAGFGGPGTAEKSEASGPTAASRSPFQSTLETYHAPTHANAASNF